MKPEHIKAISDAIRGSLAIVRCHGCRASVSFALDYDAIYRVTTPMGCVNRALANARWYVYGLDETTRRPLRWCGPCFDQKVMEAPLLGEETMNLSGAEFARVRLSRCDVKDQTQGGKR